jgi:hypothetical protein
LLRFDAVDVETKISSFELNQNFPNPFNPTTTISYSITENSNVKLTVTDLLGREVAKLVDSQQQAGIYNVKFDGTNFNSGIYFYRLKAGNYTEVKKFILVK